MEINCARLLTLILFVLSAMTLLILARQESRIRGPALALVLWSLEGVAFQALTLLRSAGLIEIEPETLNILSMILRVQVLATLLGAAAVVIWEGRR